jgi:hypothetical protein
MLQKKERTKSSVYDEIESEKECMGSPKSFKRRSFTCVGHTD